MWQSWHDRHWATSHRALRSNVFFEFASEVVVHFLVHMPSCVALGQHDAANMGGQASVRHASTIWAVAAVMGISQPRHQGYAPMAPPHPPHDRRPQYNSNNNGFPKLNTLRLSRVNSDIGHFVACMPNAKLSASWPFELWALAFSSDIPQSSSTVA